MVAHEVSQALDHDTRLMTATAALMGVTVLPSDGPGHTMWFGTARAWRPGGSRGRHGGGGAAMGIVLGTGILTVVLASLLAHLLAMAVSRQRECLADPRGRRVGARKDAGRASSPPHP